MSQIRVQKRFTISEVAADWHELMIPQRIMRPSIARASKQLEPLCIMQICHYPIQPHNIFVTLLFKSIHVESTQLNASVNVKLLTLTRQSCKVALVLR